MKCETCGAEMSLITGDRNFCGDDGMIFTVSFNKPVYSCKNCGVMLDEDAKKLLKSMTHSWRKRG